MLMPAILQFGTGRFLLAHVDLFVSEALKLGQAAGGILVVQTTGSPASAARTAALATGAGYPVRIRGLEGGQAVDLTVQCHAVVEAVQADSAWTRVCAVIESHVQVIVSNTADKGYLLDAQDNLTLLQESSRVPRSYPAKLLVLLHRRWRCVPQLPLSILPLPSV